MIVRKNAHNVFAQRNAALRPESVRLAQALHRLETVEEPKPVTLPTLKFLSGGAGIGTRTADRSKLAGGGGQPGDAAPDEQPASE